MARPRGPEPRARSVALTLVDRGAGEARPLPHPVRVRLAGPYEDGLHLAACPELGLACLGPTAAQALGQVEGMVGLALATEGRVLNAEGRRLARLLRHPVIPDVQPLEAGCCPYCGAAVPLGRNHHARRYCSASCRKRDVYAKGIYGEDRACAVCGATFHVKRKSSPTKTCGPACAGVLRRAPRSRA